MTRKVLFIVIATVLIGCSDKRRYEMTYERIGGDLGGKDVYVITDSYTGNFTSIKINGYSVKSQTYYLENDSLGQLILRDLPKKIDERD